MSNWKKAAKEISKFVSKTLEERGDDIGELTAEARDPLFKSSQMWQRVIDVDPQLMPVTYSKALSEICEIYCLKQNNPELHKQVQELQARLYL